MDKTLLKLGLTREQVSAHTAAYMPTKRAPKTDATGVAAIIRTLEVGQRVLFPLQPSQSARRHAVVAYERAKERKIKITTKSTPAGLEIERVK